MHRGAARCHGPIPVHACVDPGDTPRRAVPDPAGTAPRADRGGARRPLRCTGGDARWRNCAHHFAEAETVLGAEKLVHYSLLAGEAALAGTCARAGVHVLRTRRWPRRATRRWTMRRLTCSSVSAVHSWRRCRRTISSRPISSLVRVFDYYVEAGGDWLAPSPLQRILFPLSLRFGYTGADRRAHRTRPCPRPARRRPRQVALLAQHGVVQRASSRATMTASQLAFRERAGDRRAGASTLTLERRTLANAAFVDAFQLRWQDSRDERAAGPRADAQIAGDPRIGDRGAPGGGLCPGGNR